MALPVITLAEMRRWEQATWAGGQTEAAVIQRVGLAVAQRADSLTRPDDLILILAGKGHNGDDARAAREALVGRRVQVMDVSDPGADLQKLEALLATEPALIIDGLFGIGINRPLSSEWIGFIERVNEARIPVLAVDIPSGLSGDTGQPQGAAIRASVTLTVGAPKIGMLAQSAWEFVGRLEVAHDVGLAACPHKTELNWTMPKDFTRFPPPRAVASHKGTYGHLGIIAGSLGYHGAAVLAARAAQRAQPGLITLHTLQSVYPVIAAQLQAVMVSPWTAGSSLPPGSWTALLVGPGLAAQEVPEELKVLLRQLWRDSPLAIIVDASALDWLPLEAIHSTAPRVITPHPGEAARLLGLTSSQVQADRLDALRALSKRLADCWVVLKGHQTLVGRSTGEVFVNSSGNPYLAQGGSGDALSGYLAGLLAQPALCAEPLRTIRFAVWQHGAAADALQDTGAAWVVEDLVARLGSVNRET